MVVGAFCAEPEYEFSICVGPQTGELQKFQQTGYLKTALIDRVPKKVETDSFIITVSLVNAATPTMLNMAR